MRRRSSSPRSPTSRRTRFAVESASLRVLNLVPAVTRFEEDTLYANPVNTFVAKFIGSPAMNLLPADAVDLGLGGSGRLVGFRPEDVELANGRRADCAECDATVEVVQYLGDEQLAYLKLRDEEIVAKLPVEADLQPGMQRRLAIPHKKLHLFDAATGEAVGTVA